MKVALAGPVSTAALESFLDPTHTGLPPGMPGASVTRLAHELLQRDVDLTIVTCDPAVESAADEVVATGPRLKLYVGPFRASHRARDAFADERAWVRDALESEDLDVVHAHWSYEYALGALASGHPSLVTFRDWAPTVLRYHRHPYRAVRLGMQAAVLARSHHLTAVSPYLQSRMKRWCSRPVHVVPNGLPDEAFAAAVPRTPANARTLIAINHGFGERKNVRGLLRAFACVRMRHPCRLLLVGSGYGPDEAAERWARERELHHAVEFRGAVGLAEVSDLLSQSDVFVHPSREETFGNVLLEAMGQGVPVIGGRASGAVPWVLDGGNAGLLAEVTSPAVFAEAIGSLVASRQRRDSLAHAGYEHARARFGLSRSVDLYRELYESIATRA